MVNALVNQLLFKPPKKNTYEFSHSIIRLTTQSGDEIAATFIRKKGAHVTILVSHGNAEDLNTSFHWMRRLSRKINVNTITYDYPGYGESSGSATEENCYASIDTVFNYLVEKRGLSPHQIVLFGRSLGSGPSCYLAEKTCKEGKQVAGLILQSPFTSVYRVVLDFGFTIVGDQFPNVDRVKNIRCPVFIIHGKEDLVVPFEHGKYLYDAIPDESKATPFWVDKMGHNHHSRQVGCEIFKRINQFLDFHVLARRLWVLPSTSDDEYSPRPRRMLSV